MTRLPGGMSARTSTYDESPLALAAIALTGLTHAPAGGAVDQWLQRTPLNAYVLWSNALLIQDLTAGLRSSTCSGRFRSSARFAPWASAPAKYSYSI